MRPAQHHCRGSIIRSIAMFIGALAAMIVFAVLTVSQAPGPEYLEQMASLDPLASRISIEPAKVDFGRVAKGTQNETTVRIFNHTGSPYQIEYINTTCGCTVAEHPTKPIPANGYLDITVRMTAHRKAGRVSQKALTFTFKGWDSVLKLPVRSESVEPDELKQTTVTNRDTRKITTSSSRS